MSDGGQKPHFLYYNHLHSKGHFESNIILIYFYFEYYGKIFEPLWSPQVEFKAISYLFEIQACASVQQDLEFQAIFIMKNNERALNV